jgi:hypothetical protein
VATAIQEGILKKFVLAAVLTAALSIPALAAAGTGGNPPPTNGGSKGQGTSTVKYATSYTDPFFGAVRCTGVHQTGKNFGVNGQDSFTCASTTGRPLANTTPGEVLTLGVFGGWISDYNGVYATAFSGKVSLDGMSETAVASY